MRIDIISSLVLGTIFFFFVFCVLDVRAEVNVQPYSHKFGTTHLSRVYSVKSTASKPKLFKRSQKWTPEEEERLIRLRAQRIPWGELEGSFPGRTWSALKIKHSDLTKDPAKSPKKVKRWTKEEKELLLKLVKTGISYKEIAKQFPGRDPDALKAQYRYITRGRTVPKGFNKQYTTEEDERLLGLRRDGIAWKEIERLFDKRSLSSLMNRYIVLTSSDFTFEEDELLRELEERNIPWPQRVTFFNNRTLEALQERLEVLRSTPTRSGSIFTPEEDDLIVEALEEGMKAEEIAQFLERTTKSVHHRVQRLRGLHRFSSALPKGYRYTVDDFELIREMLETGMSWKDIAAEHFPQRGSRSVQRAYERYEARRQKENEQEE